MEKYQKPKRRNSFVLAMNLKNHRQIFKHKLEPRGGALNDQPELLEEAVEEEESDESDESEEDG